MSEERKRCRNCKHLLPTDLGSFCLIWDELRDGWEFCGRWEEEEG